MVQERAAAAARRRDAVGEHRDDVVEVFARRDRGTDTPRAPARRARRRPSRRPRTRRPSAGRGCRAAPSGCAARPSRRRGSRARAPRIRAARRASSRTAGLRASRRPSGPSGRCAAARRAIERGEPSCTTRSIEPMSIPSSSEAVATTARSSPFLSRFSASKRSSRARLPWCGITTPSPSRCASANVTRSLIRRVLDEHERRAVRADQLGERGRRSRPTSRCWRRCSARRCGTSTASVIARRCPTSTICGGRARGSARSASSGRTVAERPMRCGLRPLSRSTSSSSRASVSARCEPRLSAAIAWISSTITVCTRAKQRARLLGRQQDEERLRRRDQHVRRLAQHPRALGLRRVAGARRGADRRERDPARLGRARAARRAASRGSCACRWSAL